MQIYMSTLDKTSATHRFISLVLELDRYIKRISDWGHVESMSIEQQLAH